MDETLQEFCDSRGASLRVDRQGGIIRGVKILGLTSRNGRSYLPDALVRAVPLYEDAKVNVNHPKGSPTGPRDYQDRIGVIRNVVHQPGEGLFADFHFNPRHQLAEQLLWDAEHAPENVGFSHNVEARTSRDGGGVLAVEAILRVQSVDLVADPATTRGLFEAASEPQDSAAIRLSELTAAQLRLARPDLVEALCQEQVAELGQLRGEVDRLAVRETAAQKWAVARRLLREFHLPDPESADPQRQSIVSAHFMESLAAAADEPAMRALVEERAQLVQSLRGGAASPGKPLSRDQGLLYGPRPLDAKAFVDAIT